MKNKRVLSEGLEIFRDVSAPYIGYELSHYYGKEWWQEGVINSLLPHARKGLPLTGEYAVLVDSLDNTVCLLLFADIHWHNIFKDKLTSNHKNWAYEIKNVRNDVAHAGADDFSNEYTRRALDTMAWFCDTLDEESAARLRALRNSIQDENSTDSIKRTDTSTNHVNDQNDLPSDELIAAFNNDMVNIYYTASKLGYTPTYFWQMVQTLGGYQAAKKLIYTKNPSSGLTRLWDLMRLDLSVEAHVIMPKYNALFTDDERRICTERLEEFGYKFP